MLNEFSLKVLKDFKWDQLLVLKWFNRLIEKLI